MLSTPQVRRAHANAEEPKCRRQSGASRFDTFALCRNSIICRRAMHISMVDTTSLMHVWHAKFVERKFFEFSTDTLSVGMQTPSTTATHSHRDSHSFKGFENDGTRIARGILTHSIRMESQSAD